MARYQITYERNGKKMSIVRKGRNALDAINRLCDQYGYERHVRLIDADTYGKRLAEADILKPEEYWSPTWIFTAMAEVID